MKTRIVFIYDESKYVTEEDASIIMKTNDFHEAIGLAVLFKEKYEFAPYGFFLIEYEEEEDKIIYLDIQTYFINGKKLSLNEVPWIKVNQELQKDVTDFIYFDDNFCQPITENTHLLNINI